MLISMSDESSGRLARLMSTVGASRTVPNLPVTVVTLLLSAGELDPFEEAQNTLNP